MNLLKCRRCGADIRVESRYATNKRFCSQDCYDTWWNEYRSRGVTGAQFSEKLWGPAPTIFLQEAQKAWLAAMIDGEGWIGIVRERGRRNLSGWHFKPQVEIANSNLSLLEQAVVLVEGFVYLKHHRLKEVNHKQVHAVRFKIRAIPSLLEQVKPFLIAKRQQAELVLELCRVKSETPMRASQNADIMQSLRDQCRALNRRGTSGG